jgi:hypothetical protein
MLFVHLGPVADRDDEGSNKYVIHFDKVQTPPVDLSNETLGCPLTI